MKTFIGSILLFLSVSVCSAPEIKGNPEDLRSYFHPAERVITIRDEAEETAYTDEAIVNLVVKTEDKALAQAIKRNSELRNVIKNELVSKGVKEAAIRNSKFSSSPQYGWFGSKPNSYEVMNRVAITINNEKHLEDIATLSDRYDEIALSGNSFNHSRKAEFERLVKENALRKVMLKKEFYEKNLGVKLVPISFSESDVGMNATYGANLFEEEIIVTGMRAAKGDAYSNKKEYSSKSDASFDEIKYKTIVTVEFRVEP